MYHKYVFSVNMLQCNFCYDIYYLHDVSGEFVTLDYDRISVKIYII